MIHLTRRRFLAAGAAGGVALALAGGYAWLRGRRARPEIRAFDADALAIVRAIVPAMLAGALPAPTGPRADAIDDTVEHVRRAVEGLAPSAQAELAQLFALLSTGVGRRLFAGLAPAWKDAAPAEVDAFLVAWRDSGWALKRSAYDALHQLILAAWYANPRSWGAIGYPGPPPLGS